MVKVFIQEISVKGHVDSMDADGYPRAEQPIPLHNRNNPLLLSPATQLPNPYISEWMSRLHGRLFYICCQSLGLFGDNPQEPSFCYTLGTIYVTQVENTP
ncbi:hypothetical protein Y032_0015g2864 [Ancylostoma ceylanicum]|uniref:Uncharacterized protein n=1 Tax=Ancylostoma ceylanicum TaxID=53326 RepID=A0A016VAT4_9BILA|nr:hypothetical protein Y032_0015g2864 [Ancylostoma ceylanicum]